MLSGTQVGALGYGALARVDERGAVTGGDLVVDWWVGADDRWHIPVNEVTARQHRPFAAPIMETVVRVPGGDAAQRVYGATADGGAVAVVEIENRSPAPFTAALVVRVGRRGVVELDGTALRVDGAIVLALPRPPGAWAAAASTREIVTSGAARTGPVEPGRGPIELALLFPVAHRTTLRAALASTPVDVRALANADAAARGWDRQLERGMQAEIPPPIGAAVDAARADLLLAARHDPQAVAALEDWGFDAEAADGWARLGGRARRRARKRTVPDDPWAAILAIDPRAEPARFLASVRAVLVRQRTGAVEVLPGFPPDWLGQSVTVDAVPLHAGLLSFAVRWHGARPALLWEAPNGVELRAPALDPGWSSSAAAGEVLLAAPPTPLLPMGARDRSAGAPVPAPGEFS